MPTTKSNTVLITGASSGIGKATALYLAERGLQVIGTSRSLERLTELKSEASRRDLSITAVELDINKDEAVDLAVQRLLDEHGTIDVLVNNAGYGLWGPVESLTIDEVKAQFETNLFAALRLIKAVLPGMVREGRGTVINISSIEGRLATPFNGAYGRQQIRPGGPERGPQDRALASGRPSGRCRAGLFRTGFFENQVVGKHAESQELPYLPYIQTYRTKRARYDRLASDPIRVAKVIHKIVRSRRPGFRHPVGLEARLGALGARLLPERIFQAVLSRATIK